jgi:adenylosuccinate lyase
MRENIDRGLGLHASSRLLSALVEHGGMSREDAYGVVQRAALRAADERRPLRELVAGDTAVTGALSADHIAACFDEGQLLRHVDAVLARLDGLAARTGEEQHATR